MTTTDRPYGPTGRARIFAFMTGERVTEESAEHGDWESHGWVSPQWSMTEFFDSRNDVEPVVSVDSDDEDLAEEVADALAELGSYTDNGDGTFYGQTEHTDPTTEGVFTYAIHFKAKYRTGRTEPGMGRVPEYVERNWHPSEAGIDV